MIISNEKKKQKQKRKIHNLQISFFGFPCDHLKESNGFPDIHVTLNNTLFKPKVQA